MHTHVEAAISDLSVMLRLEEDNASRAAVHGSHWGHNKSDADGETAWRVDAGPAGSDLTAPSARTLFHVGTGAEAAGIAAHVMWHDPEHVLEHVAARRALLREIRSAWDAFHVAGGLDPVVEARWQVWQTVLYTLLHPYACPRFRGEGGR